MPRRIYSHLVACIFMLVGEGLYAQHSLKGRVIDTEGKPVGYAEVALLTVEGKLVNGALTDSLGYFALKAHQKDTYLLVVRLPGFAPYVDSVWVEGQAAVPADIVVVLRQGQQQLNPIVIEMERMWSNWQAGKQEYSPASSPVLEGATLEQVLEQIPSVEVTEDGRVLYRGMPATLYLNGKPSVLLERGGNILKSFTARQVERIEIISVPTANQDAESSGAIVNIILKKKTEYADLFSLSATVSYPALHSLGATVSMPVLGGWWSVGLSAEREWSRRIISSERHYFNPSAPYPYLRTSTREELIHQAFLPYITANYSFKGGWSASLTAMSHFSTHTETGNTTYSLNEETDNTSALRTASTKEIHTSHTADLTLTKHWHTPLPATLQVSLSAEQENHKRTQQITETSYDTAWQVPSPHQKFTITSPHQQAIAQINWQKTLTTDTSWKVEAGTKLQYRELDASATLHTSPDNYNWLLDTFPLIGDYFYREAVAALYGQMSLKVGRWHITAGVRTEYWQLNTSAPYILGQQRFTHLQAFPSVSTEVPLTAALQLGVVYSRRIDRPSFWHLAPLEGITDRTALWANNPTLQPADIHSAEVSLRVRPAPTLIVTVTPFVRHERSPIERLRWFDTTQNILIAQPVNLVSLTQGGIEVYMYWKPSARFKTTFQTSLRYGQLDATNFDPQMKEKQYGGRFFLTQEIALSQQITTQLQVRGMLPERHGNHTHENVAFMVQAGVRAHWLNKRLTTTLNIINPFNSMYFDVEIEEPDFHMHTHFSRWVPRVSLTLSYNFDKMKTPHHEEGRGMQE